MGTTAGNMTNQDALIARLRRLPKSALWALAARLKTLGLSVTPVLAGSALSAGNDAWNGAAMAAAMLSAASIQIGTNLWNDAADAERGIDTSERLGPPRMTALGLLAARDVRRGAFAAFLVAASAGLYLAGIGGWPIIAIGFVSLALGYLYSMGPYPLSGTPLGELLVIAFFGVTAVGGTVWLHGGTLTAQVALAGFFTGLPAAAVLLLNNHRDRHSDARGGRRTLAILIGEGASRHTFSVLIILALGGFAFLAAPCGLAVISLAPAAVLALHIIRKIHRTPVSAGLNALIAMTAGFQALLLLPLFTLNFCS